MKSTTKFYLPQLDGLRFFAFFLVFIHHFPGTDDCLSAHPIFHLLADKIRFFGWMGVDIFLCLSSFLLTSLLMMEYHHTGNLSIKQFFIRRALRIWPLYYLVLVLSFIIFPLIKFLSPAFHSEAYLLFASHHFVPFSIFLGNLSYAYFTKTLTIPLAPLWTVSLEEQFYIFWPILLFILLPKNKKWFFYALTSLVLLSIAVRIYIIKNAIPYPTIWVFTLARLDPFAIGALVSYLYLNPKFKPRPFLAFSIAMILFVVVMHSTVIGGRNTVWQLFVVDLAGSLLIYAALYSKRLGKALSTKPLVWLGKISFGLYIFHEIIITIAQNSIFAYVSVSSIFTWLSIFLLTLLVTVLVAALSYYGFEKHFLKLKNRHTIISSRPV